ncbi:MAG TPA: DUF3341 domain-containing protein [Oligoflexia bacterium]|nr:DUF3341 domain-containing protein [Oligoflexia bacterium]HMP26692.1 DUF3341 domain-containing protein [Oligoflexia bacterium]
MRANKAIVGVFSYIDDLLTAVHSVKQDNYSYRVYSPTLSHEIEDATSSEKSLARRFTLIGGILGCAAGWTLAIWMSLDWPMRVSAKDIVSLPGFFVVGYEWTILWGALATLLSILFLCRLPRFFSKPLGYDPRFSDDKFGLVIDCDQHSKINSLKELLSEAGAEEVIVVEH